jgi:hypothetical protein
MRVSTRLLALGLLLSACDAPPLVERGGNCHSLSDCQPGLTCVEGRCSDDLSSLRGEVPTYGMGDAGAVDAALDAEAGVVVDAQVVVTDAQVMDTGAPRPDASAPDAAGPRDSSTPDAAAPMPEASTPDTSVPVPDAAPDVGLPDADAVADAGGD